jgi:hypothetical protein
LTTIVFISLSAPPGKIESDWDKGCADMIPRRCPICGTDSIIGHGHRRKRARDERHSRIEIRRGYCPGCKTPFTFLPLFLRLTLARIVPWLTRARLANQEDLFRSELAPALQILLPLRL